MIPLSGPDIGEREKELVLEVLQSGHLGLGPKAVEFERMMAAYAGTKYAISCNSGTSGLHMLVRAMGISDGDEVITTPFSFVASSNCVLFERAKPVFVDIDEATYNMDVSQIEAKITERTKAILPVHVFGQPANMTEIRRIADKYNLRIIEDSCEAIGAKWKGKSAGSLGDAGVFAFYPNKQLTTGEGGIVVTDDEELANLCFSLRNQGRGENGLWLDHVRLGYNYRMDELSAALGVAQMERVDEILSRRAKVADLYFEKLREVPGIILPQSVADADVSWFVYVIRFAEHLNRDEIMVSLSKEGIGCRPYFTPIHLQPFYKEQFGFQEGDFPVTEHVAKGTLAIPFFTNMTEAQVDGVVEALKRHVL
ncbi:DegT/DnrJ/EryC1/StrS family aminotransferase [Tumebacillus sp. ITR2]|uniref:DegT/DnrJ/EryC1/StrS family aminotransferase n=1 Tax=Tumebacillus amylolyticus TaxID=2801339 RepID=A0ABS1JG52_9BACL|nr:DegT/DnrJ/EryC1/StrS family aminotransferase [Tumebacillus amylolyticus]MBL0389251.1 DegT/DnrJ/EryC1/StrS family aminotransferase [Tumebacillus amylolyticus]